MKKIIATLALLAATTAPAFAAGGWADVSHTDDMSDDKVSIATIMADNPSGKFMDHQITRFFVRCKDGNLETIGATNGYVGISGYWDVKITYRVGDAKARSIIPSTSTDGQAYFITGKAQKQFLKDMLSGERLRVTAYDYQGSGSFSEFTSVDFRKDLVENVIKACKVKL